MAQQVGRALRNEIADGRAGEETEARQTVDRRGELDLLGEIGFDRMDRDTRKLGIDPGRAFAQIIA